MTILHYLEKTVSLYPNKIAISDERGLYTFSELREAALSMAACIQNKLDGRTHQPVLVYLPKGKECIAAFMGIVYSRNIYTPTDVRFPFPKVQGIVDVLNPVLYISDKKNSQKLYDNGIPKEQILIYEDINTTVFDVQKALTKTIDTDPVYVFFTSGSTGVPKGVIISHRNIVDFTDWAVNKFSIDENHILGNQAPFYFDQSMPDVYLCIKTGATMCIIPENYFSFPVRLLEYMNANKINFINWVPSALCSIANKEALNNFELPYLKKVLFCGEVMPNKQLNYWRAHLPDALYVNLYGPTEAAHSCTYYIIDRAFSDEESLPLGISDENTDVFLLDADDNIVTISDSSGEICIRGSSLSYGYWNNPQKTSEAFCQNPINSHYPEIIYRTGDIAHYNSRGELIFDGRKDFQIKHLGYRIELGEIETVCMGIDGIKQISADYDDIKQEIVVFYSGGVDEQQFRRAVSTKLPKYMVPTRYVVFNELPLNDNGKIDRQKLRKEYLEV